jgi:hypothetical protein
MWLPNRLYRGMPALYAAGGVATVLLFGTHSPSVLSALLLFGAAAITLHWRINKAPPPPTVKRQRRPGELRRRPDPGEAR